MEKGRGGGRGSEEAAEEERKKKKVEKRLVHFFFFLGLSFLGTPRPRPCCAPPPSFFPAVDSSPCPSTTTEEKPPTMRALAGLLANNHAKLAAFVFPLSIAFGFGYTSLHGTSALSDARATLYGEQGK